jgi:copper transport protein
LPTLAGHSLDPGRSWIDVPLDFLHVIAASVWLGGVLALVLIVPRLDTPPELAAAAARRFSRVALAVVLLLGATGVGRAFAELSAVSQLWTTGYGRILIVKTGLFALMILLGVISRSLLSSQRLRMSASAELVVLLGLVVAVAVLTALPPGRNAR